MIQKHDGIADGDKDTAHKETAFERAHTAITFLASGNVALFFLIVLVMGLCEGVNLSYTYLRVLLLPNGTPVVMGLSTVCMIVSEVPFFYYSGPILKRYGVMNSVCLALICIFLRQAWNAIVVDAWQLLPGELLHGITYSIANVAIVDHCNRMAPEGLGMTVQSIQLAVFNGLGQGGGAMIGGMVTRTYGVVVLFAASAYFALSWAPLAAALGASKVARRESAVHRSASD